MPMHARRRFWEYEYGPWRQPFVAFGCCFGGPPWWRPSRREETRRFIAPIASGFRPYSQTNTTPGGCMRQPDKHGYYYGLQ